MEVVSFSENYIKDIVDLWNRSCYRCMPYKPFSYEGFKRKFTVNPHFSFEGTFVGLKGGSVIGFANSLYRKSYLPGQTFENTPGYITFIIIDEEYRNKGYGTQLLKKCEEYLKRAGKKNAVIDFFNPINLEWYIPDTDRHDHPNSPGVDIDGPGFNFIRKNGYVERTREVSMYIDLSDFHITEKILDNRESLEKKGIKIDYYNKDEHFGFDDLFTDLKHEVWRKEINDNLNLGKPHPVIVASDKGRICGFTGPIQVQESGRGLFSGIGVDTKHQGMGIGKVLFFILCYSFKKEGASFMSIFTGIDNNARKMYDAAGFKVVKTWALFKKEL